MDNTRPLEICYVIDNLSRSGTEMQLRLLLQNLDRNLVAPHLCLLNGQSEQSRALEPEDVTITRLGIKRLASLRTIAGTLRFRKFLRQNKIKIVQTFFPDSIRFASPISKLCGVGKVLGTRRNIGHWMTRRDEWVAKFYNRTFIDQIIANCEAARQSVINQESMAPSRVLVIPNGIDLKRFADCQPWTQTDGQPTMKIGMVGNLRDVKGPDILIDAANILLKQNNNLRFVIAGEGDHVHLPPRYQAQIDQLGIQDQFELLGSVSDVPSLLSTLDIAVLPSRAEGMPNAILEYMVAGRPIVATHVGGTPELIEQRRSGILVDPESASELAAGIQLLLDDPQLAASLAHAACVQARGVYDIHRISQLHANLYLNVTGIHE
jgi:glycosyltransferase involved in cell wall biosynthesis